MSRVVCTWTAPLILIAVLAVSGADRTHAADEPSASSFLAGQLLIATPRMVDPRFAETVIYMVDHDAGGAMGLVVNRSLGEGRLKALLKGFGIESDDASGSVRLHYGGPVESGRGFVLHSTDYQGPSTLVVDKQISVSTGLDVLNAVAEGKGPHKTLFILGYAGWGPGQLESEMARDDWLTAPADQSLIFGEDLDGVWEKALHSAGIAL